MLGIEKHELVFWGRVLCLLVFVVGCFFAGQELESVEDRLEEEGCMDFCNDNPDCLNNSGTVPTINETERVKLKESD